MVKSRYIEKYLTSSHRKLLIDATKQSVQKIFLLEYLPNNANTDTGCTCQHRQQPCSLASIPSIYGQGSSARCLGFALVYLYQLFSPQKLKITTKHSRLLISTEGKL